MKRLILCVILPFLALTLLTACDGPEFDNISANIDLTGDLEIIAFEAYSDLLERLRFVNVREGAVSLEYRIERYGEMLSVDFPFILSGSISASYKDRMLSFNITTQLYNDEHTMFLNMLAQDGEIISADADEDGALFIYMAVGEQMHEMLYGSSHIPFLYLPQADINSFGNVRYARNGNYLTLYFTLTNAIVYPDMVVDADIALVLALGVIPVSISIDMQKVNENGHVSGQRMILNYFFHSFADKVIFENYEFGR